MAEKSPPKLNLLSNFGLVAVLNELRLSVSWPILGLSSLAGVCGFSPLELLSFRPNPLPKLNVLLLFFKLKLPVADFGIGGG
jgi:hypothetical protein